MYNHKVGYLEKGVWYEPTGTVLQFRPKTLSSLYSQAIKVVSYIMHT